MNLNEIIGTEYGTYCSVFCAIEDGHPIDELHGPRSLVGFCQDVSHKCYDCNGSPAWTQCSKCKKSGQTGELFRCADGSIFCGNCGCDCNLDGAICWFNYVDVCNCSIAVEDYMKLHAKSRITTSVVDSNVRDWTLLLFRPELADALPQFPRGILQIIEDYAGALAEETHIYQDVCRSDRGCEHLGSNRRLFSLAPLVDVPGVSFLMATWQSFSWTLERKDGKNVTLGDMFDCLGMVPDGSWQWIRMGDEIGVEIGLENL